MPDDAKKPAEKAADDPGVVRPYGKKSLSASEPVVAPDGHVNLSQEDIDQRDADS